MNFSDQNLSVPRRWCRRRKLLAFSSSFKEQIGQYQPNLAQSILGYGYPSFLFSNEGLRSFLIGDNNEIV